MQKGCEVWKASAIERIVSHLKFTCWSPNFMWWYLELGVFGRFRRGREDGALMMGFVPLWEETPRSLLPLSPPAHPQKAMWIHSKEWPSATQGESPPQILAPLASWSWPSPSPVLWKVNSWSMAFCYGTPSCLRQRPKP